MDVDENQQMDTSISERQSLKAAKTDPDAETIHTELPNGKSFEVEAQDSMEQDNEIPQKDDSTPEKIEAPSEDNHKTEDETSSANIPSSENQEIAEKSPKFQEQQDQQEPKVPLDTALTCDFSDHQLLNGLEEGGEDQPAAELSPTLRRSTRASALKAQEKIRLKDGTGLSISTMVDSHVVENAPTSTQSVSELPIHTTAASDEQMEIPCKKKRKLSSAGELDQFDCKFGIRLDPEGDVVMMTDGSEISSLNDEEATVLHQKYTEAMAKERDEMSHEKVKERECQVRDLEASLRLEEAKLAMLKKIRANQQLATQNTMQENTRRLAAATSSIVQNTGGTAYKPPIASANVTAPNQQTAKLNGTSTTNATSKAQRNRTARTNTSPAGNFQITPQHQQIFQKLLESGSVRPEQIATILHSLNPSALAALSQSFSKNQQQQRDQQQKEREREQALREQQEKERRLRAEQDEARRKAVAEAEAARLAREAAQNTQQRIAAARTQLRRHLEQQLLQLPPPKAPVPDLSFIPNANQPDFLYLLGLDLVVQRNLKDKTVFKKVDFEPYVCEECGTDFTPSWKAISGDKGDLHLYCEQCVRQAQKRKVRHERTILYKKAFQKIAEQEKEFERQVTAGKFNETPAAPATTSHREVTSTSTPSTKASNFNAAALSGLANSMGAKAAISHSAASLASAVNNAVNSSASNRNLQSNNFTTTARNQPPKQEVQKKPTPSTPVSSRNKRPATSTNTSTNQASVLAALSANNPNALAQLQQMTSAFRNMNPMLAAMMMNNPQMLAQFYQMQQQQQNQNQRTSASSSSSSGNNAVSALLQAIAQSQGAKNSSSNAPAAATSNHHNQHSHQNQSHHHQPQQHHQNQNHSHHNQGGSSAASSSSAAQNLISQMSQMNPALLQQIFTAATQARKK